MTDEELIAAVVSETAKQLYHYPKMLSGDFTPQARLDQHWKDVRLILELGRQHDATLPLSQVHDGLLERASAMGFGAEDNSAVIRAFEVALSPVAPT